MAGERPRLDVLCIGASAAVDHALDHERHCAASVVLMCRNEPMLLIGAGPGTLRQALHHLGQLPPAVVLPSAQMHHVADLQAMIQYEASYSRKLIVYAPGDVLDSAIASIDEDIVADVRVYVEFLQIELGSPTSFNPHYYMMSQRCDTKQARYNLCFLDTYQKPLVSFIDGPMSYSSVFQQAPCTIVRHFRGFDADRLYEELGRTKVLVVGHPPKVRISHPAAGLRAGDAFVAPVIKGGTSTAPPGPTQQPPSDDATDFDSLWITNRGEARMHHDYENAGTTHRYESPTAASLGGGAPVADSQGWSSPPQQQQHHRPHDRQQFEGSGVPVGSSRQSRWSRPAAGQRRTSRSAGATGRRVGQPQQATFAAGGSGSGAPPRNGGRGHAPPPPPKKLYIFNNEVKESEPVIVMVPEHMTLAALKAKIGGILNVKPMGQLYTVDGGIVRDTAELYHCQEVVATKHAGAPFNLDKLPYGMEFTQPAAAVDTSAMFNPAAAPGSAGSFGGGFASPHQQQQQQHHSGGGYY